MAAKKRIAAYGRKTEFVLGLPHDTPAKTVVAKAKQAGLDMTSAYVHKVRTLKKQARRQSGPAARREHTRRAGSSERASSKRDFVRNFPMDMPAADIVRKAAQAGIKLSASYVYFVRSKAPAPVAGARRAPPKNSALARSSKDSSGLEAQFVERLLDLGLARSIQILEHLQEHLRA